MERVGEPPAGRVSKGGFPLVSSGAERRKRWEGGVVGGAGVLMISRSQDLLTCTVNVESTSLVVGGAGVEGR